MLFCKELISQLAREAVQLQTRLPHMVIGNEITSTIFPGIHLVMGLAHSAKPERRPAAPPAPAGPLGDNNYVLEHSLHQLLRHVHHKNMHHAMPHPASAPMGMSRRRRQAGPAAASRNQLLKMMERWVVAALVALIVGSQIGLGRIMGIFFWKLTGFVL